MQAFPKNSELALTEISHAIALKISVMQTEMQRKITAISSKSNPHLFLSSKSLIHYSYAIQLLV